MSQPSLFHRISNNIHDAIAEDLRVNKEVDRLYLDGKFPLYVGVTELPTKENIDFDYSRLTIISEGAYTDNGDGSHLFQGMQWQMPLRLVKDGYQTHFNSTRGKIGGIVRELNVTVLFDQITSEPTVTVNKINQTTFVHQN